MEENKKSVFEGWKFLKPKSGGVNEAGEHGGVYQSVDGKTTVMIKKENSTSKNISEFLGSQIFEAISPGNGAIITLIAPDKLNKSKSNDSQIYVKSEFFKDYSSDMYVDMDKHMSKDTKPSSWFRKGGERPLFMGSRNKLFRTIDNAFKEVKYQNFENIMPTSLLIGDFDVHIGNIGVTRDSKNLKTLPQLVRIDFAGSLNNLTNKIYPHSRAKHLPGFGPTNHFREFPSALRTKNPKFADSLLASSEVDLSKTIDKSFKELAKYYSDEAIIAFVKRAMPGQFDNSKIVTLEEAEAGFLEGITKRQESLKEYGLEIKLSTLISKKHNHPYYEIKEQELKSLMKEHPDYFNKILKYEEREIGGKRLKLYNKVSSILTRILEAIGIRPSARGQLIKTIRDLNEEVNSKKAKASTRTKEKPDLLALNEEDLKAIKKLKEQVLKPTKQEKTKPVKSDKKDAKSTKWQDEVSKKAVKNKDDMTHG